MATVDQRQNGRSSYCAKDEHETFWFSNNGVMFRRLEVKSLLMHVPKSDLIGRFGFTKIVPKNITATDSMKGPEHVRICCSQQSRSKISIQFPEHQAMFETADRPFCED